MSNINFFKTVNASTKCSPHETFNDVDRGESGAGGGGMERDKRNDELSASYICS